MILSVIVPDRTIIVDGVPLVFDFASYLPGLRALQWNGASGQIEFEAGPQTWFDNALFVQPFIDAYNAEKARIEALPPWVMPE